MRACNMFFVRPIPECFSTVWDHHNKKHIDKIESTHRRAERFVINLQHNTSSVSAVTNWFGLVHPPTEVNDNEIYHAVEHKEEPGSHLSTRIQTTAVPRSSASRPRPTTLTATVPHTVQSFDRSPEPLGSGASSHQRQQHPAVLVTPFRQRSTEEIRALYYEIARVRFPSGC